MTIMDDIKDIAKMVGVEANGSTIYEILASFRKNLAAKKAADAREVPTTKFERNDRNDRGGKNNFKKNTRPFVQPEATAEPAEKKD